MMLTTPPIQNDEIIVQESETATASLQLTCFEMLLDTMKATKHGLDPVSECCGTALGGVCCLIVGAAQVTEDNKPATRRDVRRGRANLQREHNSELNAGYDCGHCLADAAVDTLSSGLGFFIGIPRAAILTCANNNNRSNSVLGIEREKIDEVDLFDSCLGIRNCITDCCS